MAEQGKELPALALNRSLELAGKAQESYESVAARGEKLVKRVRTQKATKDLIAQAEATVAARQGRGHHRAPVRQRDPALRQGHADHRPPRGRRGRRDAIAGSVTDETPTAPPRSKKSAARTRTAAKRTATTTKKSAAATKSATKRATTGAPRRPPAAKKATTAAADEGRRLITVRR